MSNLVSSTRQARYRSLLAAAAIGAVLASGAWAGPAPEAKGEAHAPNAKAAGKNPLSGILKKANDLLHRGAKPDPVESSAKPATRPGSPSGAMQVEVGSPGAGPEGLGPEGGASDAVLLGPEPYYYESLGRRDPFVSLVTDDYLSSVSEEDRAMPDDLLVVGILWGEGDRFALVETPEGRSLILREGERFGAATVTRINPDGVVLYVNDYGVGRTIKIGVSDAKKRSNHGDEER